MTFDIIDCHSHIGIDLSGAQCSLKEYFVNAVKLNVKKALLMPVPSPVIEDIKGKIIPCLRDISPDNKIDYFQKTVDTNGEELLFGDLINPYKKVNDQLFDTLQTLNTTQEDIEFHTIPLLHPKLDTHEYIESLLSNPLIPAIKIHGIATFSSSTDLSEAMIHLLKKYNKPIIVHTDYSDIDSDHPINTLLNINNPIDRVKLGIDNEIKIFITHAARLSEEAVSLARGHQNIAFGFGPDLLLGLEKTGLYNKNEEIIERCLENIPVDQLMFDIDYGWNTYERGGWLEKDRGSSQRLVNEGHKKGVNEKDLYSILYGNAKSFFNI